MIAVSNKHLQAIEAAVKGKYATIKRLKPTTKKKPVKKLYKPTFQ